MDRKMADCRRFASDTDCSLTIIGEEEEVVPPPPSTRSRCTGTRTPRSCASRSAGCSSRRRPTRPAPASRSRCPARRPIAGGRPGGTAPFSCEGQEAREQAAAQLVPDRRSAVALGLERDRVQAHGHGVRVVVVLPGPRAASAADTSAWNWIPQAGDRPAGRPGGSARCGPAATSPRAARPRRSATGSSTNRSGRPPEQRVVLRAGLQPHLVPADLGHRRPLAPSRRPPWPPAARPGTRPASARPGRAARRPRAGPRPATGWPRCPPRWRPRPSTSAASTPSTRGRRLAVGPPGHQLGAGHVGEHARPGVVLVDDREHAHHDRSLPVRLRACSSAWPCSPPTTRPRRTRSPRWWSSAGSSRCCSPSTPISRSAATRRTRPAASCPPEYSHTLDPFVACTAAAMVTTEPEGGHRASAWWWSATRSSPPRRRRRSTTCPAGASCSAWAPAGTWRRWPTTAPTPRSASA